MGFLGLTYAALTKQPRWLATLAMIGPPVILVLGGAGGALLAAAVAGTALHVGLISFGVAALLYLVTEELLLEAHSEGRREPRVVGRLLLLCRLPRLILLEKAVDASGRRCRHIITDISENGARPLSCTTASARRRPGGRV